MSENRRGDFFDSHCCVSILIGHLLPSWLYTIPAHTISLQVLVLDLHILSLQVSSFTPLGRSYPPVQSVVTRFVQTLYS